MEYLWLFMWWLSFCILHSIFAAEWWKDLMSRSWGRYFVYYRFCYSIFAFIHLGWVLYYQFNIPGYFFWNNNIVLVCLMAPLLVGALGIMAISVWRYFFHLSGIAAFSREIPADQLYLNGLHKYVRHPLYAGTLLTVWSLFVLFPSAANLLACVVITIYTLVGIRWEEKKLRSDFGELYQRYAERTPMLIPDLPVGPNR